MSVAVALYAGSFDPIHLGHLSVLDQAARTYDEVVVAVVANPQKARGMFSPDERLRLVVEATSDLATVRAVRFYGLTVDLARREGVTLLLRSAHKERADELSMAATNQLVAGIPTVFVRVDPTTSMISSSFVRQLVEAGRLDAARELVPRNVSVALAGLRVL